MKPPKILEAEITEDGAIIIEFNQKIWPHTAKAIFMPEALLALVEEYGQIPPKNETDFPGLPLVTEEAIFDDGPKKKKKSDGDEDEDGGEEEEEEPKFAKSKEEDQDLELTESEVEKYVGEEE